MAHFAKIEDSVVTQVIVAEQEFINSGAVGSPAQWIQTSYNTRGNVHYGPDGLPDGGEPLRGNFAGIGHSYDAINDKFIPPKPFNSWVLDTDSWIWQAPIPRPGDQYYWDEATLSWVAITPAGG